MSERPETIECGSNILSGIEKDSILKSLSIALSSSKDWESPREYSLENVSNKVRKIVNGFYKE
ncbi:MAG: hypothetical protein WCY18_00985 [Methanofastidiosum sp.]|jgi:UDP-N-acetylglucosamine 2-epimerase (non-hydrolysing)